MEGGFFYNCPFKLGLFGFVFEKLEWAEFSVGRFWVMGYNNFGVFGIGFVMGSFGFVLGSYWVRFLSLSSLLGPKGHKLGSFCIKSYDSSLVLYPYFLARILPTPSTSCRG